MPSRLTAWTKNQDYFVKLEKVNSLTFKSQFSKSKETREENETSNEEDQSDVEGKQSEQQRDSDDSHSENSDEESSNSKKEEGNDEKSKGVAFQLPKRSAHSSRVIKPNKRFTDDVKAANSNKNGFGKKKGSNFENETDAVDANKKEGKQLLCVFFFTFINNYNLKSVYF